MSQEDEDRRDAKCEVLVDELILLAQEARAFLARCKPIDWTLLYGPRGTEIRRPDGSDPNDPERVVIGP